MKTISTHTFKHTLRDIHKNAENRKFCFVIGAGASRNSGIPTGGELSKTWFSEIREMFDITDFDKWLKKQKIDQSDLASNYGNIYRKRFENDKTSGYEFLVQAMKSAKPSVGHIVLAQILSRSQGHCVLTTNFDSLVESSVYQFTNKTPLVCGHESLSGYARPSNTHPLIIKIHRDLLLEPKSDPDEINTLAPGWKAPLDHIFSTHIPIVIGYGGNDGSLMSYFESMNKPSNFFWCGLDGNNIAERIKKLIEKQDGRFVTVEGFDELMHELLWVFDEIKPIKDELREITNERIQIATRQLDEITTAEIKLDDKLGKSLPSKKEKELSALEYSNLAEKEPDLEKRKRIFLEALEKYPATSWLWWRFTRFLQFIKKDYRELDKYYQRALDLNKNNDAIISDYAIYLAYIKKDIAKAEEFYLKAIANHPDDAGNYSSYAIFLDDIKHDIAKAEQYYLKSIEVDPYSAIYYSNYAFFLHNVKKSPAEAEKQLLKALSIDPNDGNTNGNYAQLLLIKEKFKEAEINIERAFDNLSIEDENTLIELWFYRYAHYSEYVLTAESKLEELLSLGVRSLYSNFDENIRIAVDYKHPSPEKLKEFARRIITE